MSMYEEDEIHWWDSAFGEAVQEYLNCGLFWPGMTRNS